VNIFDFLETCLEPKLNNIKFNELEPTETVKKFIDSGLFKKIPITEADCNECPENCRGLNIELIDGKLAHTCPTGTPVRRACPDGFLETPRELTPDETQGWQFDFSHLAELICDKSKLTLGGATDVNNLMSIAYDRINGKNIAVIYGYGLGQNKDILIDCFSMFRVDVLFIITPSMDALKTGGIKELKNIYLIPLKTVIEEGFSISAFIKESLTSEKPSGEVISKFPVPQGTKCGDISIEFISKDEVKISMPELQHPYAKHFSAMGFQDDRRAIKGVESNMAWRVFRLIAQNQGEWTLGILLKEAKVLSKKKGFDPAKAELSAAAQKEEYLKQFTGMRIEGITISSIPKYVELLRKRLKEYFGLTEDPFYPYYAKGKKPGYKAKFRVFCSYQESLVESPITENSDNDYAPDENSTS
jgi:hypothetical protein